MRLTDRWATVLVLVVTGCGGASEKSAEPADKNIGQQTADITADTRLLREASAAVNEVLRNQDDCAAARPAIEAATAKLDEAKGRVRTQAGQVSLQSMRTQVGNVANICP